MDDTERLEQIEAELITRRLAQIDDHIAALEAKASEPATASEPAKAIETKAKSAGMTQKFSQICPIKSTNDRTIHG